LAGLYAVLCILTALRLGVSFGFAATSLALAFYILSLHPSYGGGLTLSGDLVVLACAMAIVLLAPAFEQSKAIVSVAVVLALALSFKAQGASLYVGTVLFLATRQGIVLKKKIIACTAIGLGLLTVTVFLYLMPNCWEACVGAMSKHPRSIERLVKDLA